MTKERDTEPTIRSQQLGTRLIELMTEKNITKTEVGRRLGLSTTFISNLTRSIRPVTQIDLARILVVLGVIGAEKDELMALCDDLRKPGLWEQYGERMPPQVKTLVWYEERAHTISQFQSTILPGLLQTSEYARTLIDETGNVPDADDVDERVFARMSRQVLLTRKPRVEFTFYIHEFVFRLRVGGENKAVMRAQLQELLRLADHENISIRVVPAALGGHPGTAGHFELVEGDEYNPVAYIDNEVSSLFLEAPLEIKAYREVLLRLDETALDEAQSGKFIADVATELYS